MACSHILVTGMMGCGKTTIGRDLSLQLGFAHVDTDYLVEQACGMTTARIFSTYGEPEFRNLEFRALLSALSSERRTVISTGGGTMCNAAAWSVVPPEVMTVWLDVPPAVLSLRLCGDTSRPLLGGGSPNGEILERLLEIRRQFYARAELCCNGDMAAEQIINNIIAYERNRK
ncbi:MAG: shikimate kinase [Myxococcales bacterium]|nr:shikimate kinase [Myxococcales bacterium]